MTAANKRRVAVVGSGISGLTVAHTLSPTHDVVIYEADDRLGGHTHTHTVEIQGQTYTVDSGFIVFNHRTYPNFIRLLEELGVGEQFGRMCFSVVEETTGLEWASTGLVGIFAQRKNVLNPRIWRMIRDILRFNKHAKAILDEPPTFSIGDYLKRENYSDEFRDLFLIPMGAAIWSAPLQQFLKYPASSLLRFMQNHGLNDVNNQPDWYTVKGGSSAYIEQIMRRFSGEVRLNSAVTNIKRGSKVTITDSQGNTDEFDEVVLACHSSQVLPILDQPTDAEKSVLQHMRYQLNEAVLHTDASLLPRNRRAWASWNTVVPENANEDLQMTYHMNRLQQIDAPEEICVTLNATHRVDPDKILAVMQYEHPVYDVPMVQAQSRRHEISGHNNTYYCGAYWYNGFHEDGCRSGLDVCAALGAIAPDDVLEVHYR